MNTALIGNYALTMAILASGGAALLAICAARFRSDKALRLSHWAIHLVTALLTLASAALLRAIIRNEFALDYVVSVSAINQGIWYKVAAFWAGSEGSLLLWSWMLAVMASLSIVLARKDPRASLAPSIGFLAVVLGAFVALTLLVSNPFTLGKMVPADGRGMNPLLLDPAMIAHPPLLFLGYAGFAIPFAFCLGALVGHRRDNDWIAPLRKWVIASWLFLTIGIALGAWWAYIELGWGGYWAWDPVENASLLPWFTGTALMHSMLVHQRRGTMKLWNAILIPLTFCLCIFGTYLTRSGVISSVHAFPESSVGQFILEMLRFFVILTVVVLVCRRDLLKSDRPLDRLISHEGAFIAGSSLLVVMMLITIIGTMYPILSKPFSESPITLGPKFYNHVVVPVSLVLVGIMGFAPVLRFAGNTRRLFLRLIVPVIGLHVAVIITAIKLVADIWNELPKGAGQTAWYNLPAGSGWALVTAGLSTFVVLGIVQDFILTMILAAKEGRGNAVVAMFSALNTNMRRSGAMIAHLGMIMIVVAAAWSSLFSKATNLTLSPGDTAEVGRYTLKFHDLTTETKEKEGYVGYSANVTLSSASLDGTALRPEKRIYPKLNKSFTEVAINSSLREDVYLILHGWGEDGNPTHLEVIIKPMVIWMWIGSVTMCVGALVCLLDFRRKRKAAFDASSPSEEVQL